MKKEAAISNLMNGIEHMALKGKKASKEGSIMPTHGREASR